MGGSAGAPVRRLVSSASFTRDEVVSVCEVLADVERAVTAGGHLVAAARLVAAFDLLESRLMTTSTKGMR